MYENVEKHTSSREAKPLNPWVSIRKMKCNTSLISSTFNYLFILFLHFNFFSYHNFNGFCLHEYTFLKRSLSSYFNFLVLLKNNIARYSLLQIVTSSLNLIIVCILKRPWRRKGVLSEILVTKNIYIYPTVKSVLLLWFRSIRITIYEEDDNNSGKICADVYFVRQFHSSHNAPLLPHPKSLHKYCFQFLLGRLKSYAKFWRVNKVHYGICWSGV